MANAPCLSKRPVPRRKTVPSPKESQAKRERFNARFLLSLDGKELHYVYALVDQETKTVGYFGVTNDPYRRRWQHKHDLWYRKDKESDWKAKFGRPPEMVLLVLCPNRQFAEVVERALIARFTSGYGPAIMNDYKYWNPKQAKRKDVQDDIPFLSVGDVDGFLVDWTKQLKNTRWRRNGRADGPRDGGDQAGGAGLFDGDKSEKGVVGTPVGTVEEV